MIARWPYCISISTNSNDSTTNSATPRAGETLARLGGEEFSLLCPNADEREALGIAERLRMAVERAAIRRGEAGERLTISVGVAVRRSGVAGHEDLMHQADSALYAAKRQGRNRVCLYHKEA